MAALQAERLSDCLARMAARVPLDDLTVRVEASEKLYQDSDSAGAVGRKLAATLQSRLGVGCRVEVVAPKQMPRSEGKAVRIVDNRRI